MTLISGTEQAPLPLLLLFARFVEARSKIFSIGSSSGFEFSFWNASVKMGRMADEVNDFETAFAARMLTSEARRARLLAWTFSIVTAFSVVFYALYQLFDYHVPGMEVVMLTFMLAAGYEWLSRYLFQRLIDRKQQPPRWRFYANAFVEASLPTLTLAVMLNFMESFQALTSSITYLYFLIILLSTLRLNARLCLFTGLVAAAGFGTLVLWEFSEIVAAWDSSMLELRINLGMRILLLIATGYVAGLVSSSIHSNLRETLQGLYERQHIIDVFGQHVSPEVVNRLLNQPREPKSAQREICVLVLDIRNFTTFSEDRPADEVVAYLNTLWGSLVRIVNANSGIVNKFLGDGFLAVFGAPIHSENFCQAALSAAREMLDEVKRLEAAGKIPATQLGIALHAGVAIVGEIGSEQKKEYTVIGDVVNVAFRIEALNKELKSQLLISAPVCEQAGVTNADAMEPRPIRGRREPIQLFRLA